MVVVDFLVGFFVMLCLIDSVLIGEWCFGYFWGRLNVFGNFCFCILFIMYLVLLFVDCFIFVLWFLKYIVIVIKIRVCIVCLVMWIYLMFWVLLLFFGISLYECFIFYIGKCFNEDWFEKIVVVLFIVLVVCGIYGVVVLVMIFVYVKIFIVIFK